MRWAFGQPVAEEEEEEEVRADSLVSRPPQARAWVAEEEEEEEVRADSLVSRPPQARAWVAEEEEEEEVRADMVEYLTLREARERLGLSEYRLRSLIRQGRLRARRGLRDMRTQLIARSEVEALAAELAGQPAGRKPAPRKRRGRGLDAPQPTSA